MRSRKRFGQHFLHDPAVIRRIVQAVAPQEDGHLVEIGPGRGAMTQLLLESHGALDAIEIDRDLAALLREEFAHDPRFVLHEADAQIHRIHALVCVKPPSVEGLVGARRSHHFGLREQASILRAGLGSGHVHMP